MDKVVEFLNMTAEMPNALTSAMWVGFGMGCALGIVLGVLAHLIYCAHKESKDGSIDETDYTDTDTETESSINQEELLAPQLYRNLQLPKYKDYKIYACGVAVDSLPQYSEDWDWFIDDINKNIYIERIA